MRFLATRKCRCGATRERRQALCTKCQHRADWYRRKAWKTRYPTYRHGGDVS